MSQNQSPYTIAAEFDGQERRQSRLVNAVKKRYDASSPKHKGTKFKGESKMTEGALTTIFSGGKVAIKGDAAALAKAFEGDLAETGDGQGGSGDLFLNFSGKRGVYSLGREKDDMDPEEAFAVMPESMTRGWVFWKSSKVTKRHRWAVGAPGIAEEDLEDLETKMDADGWKSERSFKCKSLERGTQAEFSTSTVSACNAIGDLMTKIGDRIKAGDGYYPIIGFDKEEFTAHEQTNWKPKFIIFGWATMEALVSFMEGETELDDLLAGDEEEKPKAKKSKAKEKSEPKRRRRPAL